MIDDLDSRPSASTSMVDDLDDGSMHDDLGDVSRETYDEGEIRTAPATWGDVGTAAAKILTGGASYGQKILGKGLSPQEDEAYWGTILPSTLTGVAVAGGPASLLGREALGLTTGGVTRGLQAKARGEDVSDAVLSPGNIALDAGMSAIPEVWAGAKALGRALPEAVQAPARAAGRAVASKAGELGSRAAHWVASKYPRYGETLIDPELPAMELGDIFDRPPLDIDPAHLVTEPPPVMVPEPQGATLGQRARESLWQGPIRAMADDEDPVVRTAGLMIRRRNNLAESLKGRLAPEMNDVLGQITPEQGPMVGAALETPLGPHTPEPILQARGLLDQVDEARRGQGVWDQTNMTRALELMDDGPAEQIGTDVFAPAQRTRNYFPHMAATEPDTGRSLTRIERIMASDPDLTARQAMRRLDSTAKGGVVGHSRTGSDWEDYTRDVHDVLPRYVEKEIPRIANAAVFGGKPVKLTLELPGGVRKIDVGEKAASVYEHMLLTGNHEKARQFGGALAEMYDPTTTYAGQAARKVARGVSNMALSHSALTQVGQAHTPIWASGGVTQLARGQAMVDKNPLLRELFESGPKQTDFVDYIGLGRGSGPERSAGALPGPMDLMRDVENWLRGPDSYASVAMIDDVSREAKALRDAGQPYTRALMKQADEIGVPLDYLVDEIAKDGVLSRGTWLEGIQNLVKRWQYSTAPGEIPNALRSPTGALAAQYKSYGIKASQHVKDDIVDVIVEAYKTGDPSMRRLAMQRARDFGFYGAGSNALSAAIKAGGRGRLPLGSQILQGALTGPTGIVGETAYRTADALTPEYGERPLEQLGAIPALSVPLSAGQDVLGAFSDPGRAAAGALKLAGAYDPRIPLYGTLPLGVAREATR